MGSSLPEEEAYLPGLLVAHVFSFDSVVEIVQRFAGDTGQKIPTAGECYDLVSVWVQERKSVREEHDRAVEKAEAAAREKRGGVRINVGNGNTLGKS